MCRIYVCVQNSEGDELEGEIAHEPVPEYTPAGRALKQKL